MHVHSLPVLRHLLCPASIPLLLCLAACSSTQRVNTGFVQLDADRLYYETTGESVRIVLIGGGGVMDLRQWDDLFETLRKRYGVLRYDPRGVGRSDLPTVTYADAEDLRALLDAREVDRAVLVGLSSGGGIALEFAIRYPERVDGLILAAPFVGGFQPSPGLLQRMNTFVQASEEGAEAFIEAILLDEHFIPAPRRAEARAYARVLIKENFKSFGANPSLVRPLNPPVAEQVRSIAAPTLLLIGALDHTDLFRRIAFLEEQVAGAERIVVEDAGHMSNMENPAAFAAAVEGFLRRLGL